VSSQRHELGIPRMQIRLVTELIFLVTKNFKVFPTCPTLMDLLVHSLLEIEHQQRH
jgi:hypothetical protein